MDLSGELICKGCYGLGGTQELQKLRVCRQGLMCVRFLTPDGFSRKLPSATPEMSPSIGEIYLRRVQERASTHTCRYSIHCQLLGNTFFSPPSLLLLDSYKDRHFSSSFSLPSTSSSTTLSSLLEFSQNLCVFKNFLPLYRFSSLSHLVASLFILNATLPILKKPHKKVNSSLK